MRQHKSELILFVAIFSILASQFVIGQFPWQDKEKAEVIKFIENSPALVSKLQEMAENFKNSYLAMYYELSKKVKFINFFSDKVDDLMEIFTKNLIPLLLFEPQLENPMVINLVRYSVSLVGPFYIISLLFTGTYLLFISASPKGRMRAKSALIKLILGLGIIMLTIPIIQSGLEVFHTFSSLILSAFHPDINVLKSSISFLMGFFVLTTFFEPETGIPFLFVSIFLPFSVLFILSLRYLMIILLTASFPFTILFYSFAPTQRLGKRLLYWTFLWIFLPLIQVFILSIISISFKICPITELNIFISLSGFFLLIFAPLIMVGLLNFILGLGTLSVISRE